MAPPLAAPDYLSKAAAIALAHAHVGHLNATSPPPGEQRWVVGEPVEYTPYWYFDYRTALPLGKPRNLTTMFAYAPGYLIWKQTHACSLVGWGEYPTLAQREQLYQQASHLADWLVAEPLSIARLRPKLRLPLAEVAQLSYTLRALTDTAAQVAHLFPYLHVQALAEAHLAPLPFILLGK